MRGAWLACCVVGLAPAASADPVTFAAAIARAGDDGPSIAARKAAADAARLLITPAGQLPDPQISLGLQDAPISGPNRFRLDQDNFTMLNFGVMQEVPSGAKRRARTGVAEAETGVALADLAVSRVEARLAAASAWIDAYYATAREAALQKLVEDNAALSNALSASAAAGAAPADALLAARIEAARIADRAAEARFAASAARSELERWIGPIGADQVGPTAPAFQIDPEQLRDHLDHHVALSSASASIARARAEVELARAGAHPDWSWDVTYGRRDPMFGDYVSLGLKFSLPLFQSTRQSPTIDARRADVRRADAEYDARFREHTAMLEAKLVEHASLDSRLTRARDIILPLARQRESVAVAAHAAGTLPLASLITARAMVLEAELDRIELEHRLSLVDAFLTLQYGEDAQ